MRSAESVAGLFFTFLNCMALGCSSSSSGSTSTGDGGGGGDGGGAGAAGSSSTGQGGAGGAMPCDGTPDQWCGYEAYCDAPEGICPGGGVTGTCAPRPADCTGEAMAITCACNDQIYINACEPLLAGVEVGPQAGCEAPQNPFECGPVLCETGTHYCESINGYRRCLPLPEGCKIAGSMCDCLNDVLCVAAPGDPECEKNADGNFFVSCIVTE